MTMLDCYETIKRVRWATFDVKVLRVPLLIIFWVKGVKGQGPEGGVKGVKGVKGQGPEGG